MESEREPITSAVAMGKDSLEFLDAAKVLAGKRDASITHIPLALPFYFLLCHAMELSMKSYLRAKGYNDRRLVGIGHSLDECLSAAIGEGLVVAAEFSEMSGWLNRYHYENAFRYHKERYLSLPLPHELIECVEPQVRTTVRAADAIVRAHLRSLPS